MTPILRCRVLASLIPAIFAVFGVLGCNDKTAEPAGQARSAEPLVAPLVYEVPPTWVQTESSQTGTRRAGYRVPKAGADTEDAELLVLFYGTGSNGDRDKTWDPWFKQFDGDAKTEAARETFEVGGNHVETFEVVGTYKLNVGPRKPGTTSSPVQMVKKDYRMIGVMVRTPDRGNWYLRLVGPTDTVVAHKAELRALIEGAK